MRTQDELTFHSEFNLEREREGNLQTRDRLISILAYLVQFPTKTEIYPQPTAIARILLQWLVQELIRLITIIKLTFCCQTHSPANTKIGNCKSSYV